VDRWERELSIDGFSRVAGIDEAGRGPLAGPVVAAAVIFKKDLPMDCGIADSKTISQKRREALVYKIFSASLAVGLGISWHDEIDGINIHRASLKAMERAVASLDVSPDFLLIDGKFPIDSSISQRAIVRGDSLSISIAAASIIAKTARDRIMTSYERLYPGYGFARHKGYGTKAHMRAIADLGPSPIHRRTFSPLSLEKRKLGKENLPLSFRKKKVRKENQ